MKVRFDIRKTKKLVVEGCALKFPSVLGSFLSLEEHGVWDQITDIAASSGAAFPLLCGMVGKYPSEMIDHFMKFDAGSLAKPVSTSKIPLVKLPLSLFFYNGFTTHDNVVKFIKQFLKQHCDAEDAENLTFAQHAIWRQKKNDPRIKNIHLTGTVNSTTSAVLTFFSHEGEGRDVPIAEALASAISYPTLFPPKPILMDDEFKLVSDGGLRNILPFSAFPDSLEETLGIKPDTHEEVFDHHYYTPRLTDLYFWHLIQNMHGSDQRTYGHRTIQIHDGNASSFKRHTRLEKRALIISGKLATNAKFAEKIQTPQETKSVLSAQERAAIGKRTTKYKTLIDSEGCSRFLFPTLLLNLQKVRDEIGKWDEEQQGYCVFYTGLLNSLFEKMSSFSLTDLLITGQALAIVKDDLLCLLRDRAAAAAIKPIATSALITAVTVAYLETQDAEGALKFLTSLEKSPNASLLVHIDHERLLKLAKHHKKLCEFLESYLDKLLQTKPGAYEACLVVKLSKLIEKNQFSAAEKFLDRVNANIAPIFLEDIYQDALLQLPTKGPRELVQLRQKIEKLIPDRLRQSSTHLKVS